MIAKHCVIMDASLFKNIKATVEHIADNALVVDDKLHDYTSTRLLGLIGELKDMLSFVEE